MAVRAITNTKIAELLIKFRERNNREWIALLATLFSMFNKFISLLAVFLYVRWTLPYLGKERFGVWMTMSTIVTFITIFSDLGLGSSLVNQIAAVKSREDLSKIKEITSSAFFFMGFMGLIVGAVITISYSYILPMVNNGLSRPEDIYEIRISLIALFTIFVVALPFSIVDKSLEGLQLTYISSIWATAGNILSLAITFFITKNHLGIFYLVLSTVGVQSLFRIFYFCFEFNSRLKPGKPTWRFVHRKRTMDLLKSGILFFTLNIFNVLAFQLDNIYISGKLGVSNVPLFSLMQKLVTISLFFWFYTISLWPTFAEAHARNDINWIKKTVRFVFLLNISLGLLFGLVILFFADPILSFWSKGIISSPSLIMRLSFVSFIVLNGMIGTVSILFNTGPLLRKHIPGFCLAALVTIILKVLLIEKIGVDYLMFVPFAPFIIFYLIPCFFIYRKYVKAQN